MTQDDRADCVLTGYLFDPPEAPYFRFLVSQTWPAGIARGAVDQWDRELAPPAELVDAWRGGTVSDRDFARSFEAELGRRAGTLEWVLRAAQNSGIVLVDEFREGPAPRMVLAEILRSRLADWGRPSG